MAWNDVAIGRSRRTVPRFQRSEGFWSAGNQHIEKEVSEPMTDTTAVMNKPSLSLASLNTTRQQMLHFAERDGAATYALTHTR
jgi:hypothetical protein